MLPRDLIQTAAYLAKRSSNKPRQSDLKRAVSTVYYALFHALARCCADSMIGAAKKGRANRAWQQVYRSLDHGIARKACQNGDINRFPQEIQDFSNTFVGMQLKRHSADYDPFFKVYKSQVLIDIENVKSVLGSFSKTGMTHKKAFAAWVLLKQR